MKRLDSFILRSYLGPFVLTFFISVFILLMQFVWKYVDEMVGRGLGWMIVTKFFLLVSVTMVSLALPLAILLSSLMTFGNLGEHFELTAIKASGISLQRAIRPVLLFATATAVFAFYFANNVQPVANLKMRTLLHDIRDKRPELNIKPGIFNADLPDIVIRVGKKSRDGKELEQIMIYDHSNHAGNDRLIIAEKGIMDLSADKRWLELRLINGHTYTETEPGRRRKGHYPFLRENFSEDLLRFELSLFKMSTGDENLFRKNYQMLNLTQLGLAADTLREQLAKDKATLAGILFRGNFYEKTKPWQAPRDSARNVARFDTALSDSSNIKELELKIALRRRMDSLIKGITPDSSKPPALAFSPEPSSTAAAGFATLSGRPVQLKNRKEVLSNFSKADRIRILEAAANTIRSNKSTLDYSLTNFEQEQERINRHEIERHRKFTLSFACIIFFLIGAPLGAIVRKGGLGMPVIFSLVFFILYHMISITGEKLAREGVLSSFAGMWLSSFILLPLSIFFTWKATHDSVLFDREAYGRFFASLFRWFRKKPLQA